MELDKREKINKEVDRLLSVGLIKLVEYPKWASNMMAFSKTNGNIKAYFNFTGLNKIYLVHPYSLPHINNLVDTTIEYCNTPRVWTHFSFWL